MRGPFSLKGKNAIPSWVNNYIHHLVWDKIQYIPRNMHTVFALLCFVVVIHWLIFPYPSGLLHWHCGNLTIAPVPAKQPWWIWINTSRDFIMNDCITTTKQNTTKPCAYFLGYTVLIQCWIKAVHVEKRRSVRDEYSIHLLNLSQLLVVALPMHGSSDVVHHGSDREKMTAIVHPIFSDSCNWMGMVISYQISSNVSQSVPWIISQHSFR